MEQTKFIYLIKDLSRITGFSVYTLKYYLNLGLIKEMGRSPSTNFRYFDELTIKALDKIKVLRNKKIPLKKIAEIIGDI